MPTPIPSFSEDSEQESTSLEIPCPSPQSEFAPTFTFYDDEDEIDDDAPTKVTPLSDFDEQSSSQDVGYSVLESSVLSAVAPQGARLHLTPSVSVPTTSDSSDSGGMALAITCMVLGAALISGMSILVTLMAVRETPPSTPVTSGASATAAGVDSVIPPQDVPVLSAQQLEEIEPEASSVSPIVQDDPDPPEGAGQSTSTGEVGASRGDLEGILGSLAGQVEGCTRLSGGYRPRSLAIQLVSGEEQRITVSAISPPAPAVVGRCIARAIHSATWPTPRATRPRMVFTYRFER